MKRKFVYTPIAIGVRATGAMATFILTPAIARSHTAAIRNQYLSGAITLEEARRELGDDVDTHGWPTLKAEWRASK